MKNKVTAGLFGILLGGFGAHKFYLGNVGLGIVYLLFCWTGIPEIIGLIEGIIILGMSDQEFNQKYNPGYMPPAPQYYPPNYPPAPPQQ